MSGYRLAVGLQYEQGTDEAPSVSVKGSELRADEVVRIARRFGVPVVERPELARALDGLEIDERIPPELFRAVAILLHQVSNIVEGRRGRFGESGVPVGRIQRSN